MKAEIAAAGISGRDAELKTSKNGKHYIRFSVRNGDGDQAQWLTIMYFGDDAAEIAQRVKKGSRCFVEGSLRLDSWAGRDGQKRTGLTVMATYLRVAAIGRDKPKPETAAKASRPDLPNDEIPW